MIGITDRPAIAGIFAAFAATSSKAPKAVAAAHEHLVTTVDRYARRPLPDPEALALAVMAALDAGTDPAVSPDVQAVLTSGDLAAHHPMADTIRGVCTDVLRTACQDHTDDIIGAWRPGFTEAATDLAVAHADLGAIDLADTDLIVRRGPAATASWSAASAASAPSPPSPPAGTTW